MRLKSPSGWLILRDLALFVVVLLAPRGFASAQETIYVAQMNPSQVHAFTFDGTHLVRQDLDPASAGTTWPAGVDPYDLQVTDRYSVTYSGLMTGGLGLAVVDPAIGLELPRPRLRGASSGSRVLVTPEGHFALAPGIDHAGAGFVSVVDLRPSAATFLKQIAALTVPWSGSRPSQTGAVLTTDGARLFLGLYDSVPRADGRRWVAVRAVDVSNPTNPSLGPETLLTPPASGPGSEPAPEDLSVVDVPQGRFLFIPRRGLYVYEVQPGEDLRLLQVIRSYDAQGRECTIRRLATTGNLGFAPCYVSQGGVLLSEKLLVLDLTWDSQAQRFDGSTVYALSLPGASRLRLAMSHGGQYIFALDSGAPAKLHAITATRMPTVLDTVEVDPAPDARAVAYGLVVRPAVQPASDPPRVDAVAVEGIEGAVLVNDRSRSVTIRGTGLASARHVFIGLTRAQVRVAGPDQVEAIAPPLVPAGTQPVIVVTEAGASATATLVVANAPGPATRYPAFAAGFGSNEIAVLNSVDPTGTPRRVPTGQGPTELLVSPDGRWLFVSGIRGAGVSVHTLIEDPARGAPAYSRVLELDVGGFAQQLVLDPHRRRLYVAALGAGVCVVDVDSGSPTFLQFLDIDHDSGTTTRGLPPGISCIEVTGFRGLALTPDGGYLYVGRSVEPRLQVVRVSDDPIDPEDVKLVSIPDAPVGQYRFDGLAVVPALGGQAMRLYASLEAESFLRVFDLSDAWSPAPLLSIEPPDWAPDIRRIASSPDGRAVYVSSREAGTVDVFDTVTNSWVRRVAVGAMPQQTAVTLDGQFLVVGAAEDDAAVTVDLRSASPTQYQVVARTWGALGTGAVAVSPGLETGIGEDVSIAPLPGVTVTFSSVTEAGHTSVTSAAVTDVVVPDGFVIERLPVFYDVRTTAVVAGGITVCLPYDDAGLSSEDEAALSVLHEEGGVFVDRTVARDPDANVVCAEVASLSQFVVAQDRRFETLLTLIRTDAGIMEPLRHGLAQIVTEAEVARARKQFREMNALLRAFETRVRAQSQAGRPIVLIAESLGARMIALARSLRTDLM